MVRLRKQEILKVRGSPFGRRSNTPFGTLMKVMVLRHVG